MVEGRISAGVVVGPDSDIGGSASIMGTLSGGGTQVVSVGSGCLLGANAGIGISLGDGCVVEAGCYVTAGSRVTLPEDRKSTRLNSSHANISYAVFCLKKKYDHSLCNARPSCPTSLSHSSSPPQFQPASTSANSRHTST